MNLEPETSLDKKVLALSLGWYTQPHWAGGWAEGLLDVCLCAFSLRAAFFPLGRGLILSGFSMWFEFLHSAVALGWMVPFKWQLAFRSQKTEACSVCQDSDKNGHHALSIHIASCCSDSTSIDSTHVLWELRGLIQVKCLEQCPASVRHAKKHPLLDSGDGSVFNMWRPEFRSLEHV